MKERSLLIFVSDIHLTDSLHSAAIPRAAAFMRFWERIQAARGKRPATLCFVGDLFDLVRSPRWFESKLRPYDPPSKKQDALLVEIVSSIIDREADFFSAIRKQVESGALEIKYVLGNHDRLLRFSKKARRLVNKAFTGDDQDISYPTELEFPEHRVIAYHGNTSDVFNHDPEGGPTIGDAIGSELITRFPTAVRSVTGEHHPKMDDIDDVRPLYAVPAWVRQLGVFQPQLLKPINMTWVELVETFFSKPFVKDWMRSKRRVLGIDPGKKLRLMLELSTKRVIAKGSDKRLTELYKMMQHSFDGRMALHAAKKLDKAHTRYRYVVNGHSHFANMVPLGNRKGDPAVYFNTGTWRSVHQIGHGLGGRPTFLPYDAMSYLVFFPDEDDMGRNYEWWNGALVARQS